MSNVDLNFYPIWEREEEDQRRQTWKLLRSGRDRAVPPFQDYAS